MFALPFRGFGLGSLRHLLKEKRFGALRSRVFVQMFGGIAKRIDQTLGSGPFLFSQDLDAALHVDVRSYIVVIFVTIFGAKSNNQNDVSALL